jgi:hypothetical protein
MVIGTFSVNDLSVVVLFDSRASHSFIFAAYAEKRNLPMALLRCRMIVSSPGGDMPVRQLCPKVNLKIRGVAFVANLIVLESMGIDVILGMDWLGKHKELIDYAKKSVQLTTPDGKELEFVAEPVVIKMCKVQWSHHTEDVATWEREEELKAKFPCFFSDPSKSRGRDSF